MSVIPKAYSYVPGATTGAAHIAGIRAMLAVSEYWQESAYTPTLLTITNKTLPYEIRIVISVGSLSVLFSHDGVLFSTSSSVTSTNSFSNTNLGAGTDIAWIVETEDSLSWYTRSVGAATTQTAPHLGALGFSFSAGRIFTPDNRSDDANNIGVFGVLAGHASMYLGAANALFCLSPGPGGSKILFGNAWEQIEIQTSFARAWSQTLPTQFPSVPNRQYSAAMGDSGEVERLPPIRVVGATSGTTSNLRYLRARYFAVGGTDSSGLIESTSIRVSSGDPNVAWRHSAYSALTGGGTQTSPQNTIYLWAPTTTAL